MYLPNKIVITGTSGCGKTFLGKRFTEFFGRGSVDLDDLYWLPNWSPRSEEEFYSLIQQEISSDAWIICGNYSRAKQAVWEQADMIIWLDLPFSTCLWRAFKRSLIRWITQEPCCNGNCETLGRLFGKNSIILWVWKTYNRRKEAYSEYFNHHNDRHKLIRLQNSKEIDEFMLNLRTS